MKTFSCQFTKTISCTVIASETPPPLGEPHLQSVVWTGRVGNKKLQTKIARAYTGWMNSVNSTLAKEWNRALYHAYAAGPGRHQLWLFVPGHLPKLLTVAPTDSLAKAAGMANMATAELDHQMKSS